VEGCEGKKKKRKYLIHLHRVALAKEGFQRGHPPYVFVCFQRSVTKINLSPDFQTPNAK